MRPYLEGYKFFDITDHASLKWLDNLREPTGRLARWAVRLQQFDYKILHRIGKDHVVPDLLSRAVPNIDVINIDHIQDGWYKKMIQRIQEKPLNYPDWRVQDNVLQKHVSCTYPELSQESNAWKMVVPKENRPEVLFEAHDRNTSGHSGIYKTYERLESTYYWPKMRADVTRYVRHYQTCLAYKSEHRPPPGLMGNRPKVSKPWQLISVDLVGPLPRSSQGYVYILVVSDYFSKFPLMFPLRKASAKSVVRLIEENVFLSFGTPEFLICDNGTQFRSREFTHLCEYYQVTIMFTSPYHPQANPVERVNGTLKIMLSSYIRDNQKSWDKMLPIVACVIRTSKHEVTGQTPFFVNFVKEHCVSGKDYQHPVKDSEMPLDRSNGLKTVYRDVEKRIQIAHERSKVRYDLRRRPVEYKMGDRV